MKKVTAYNSRQYLKKQPEAVKIYCDLPNELALNQTIQSRITIKLTCRYGAPAK